MMECHREYAEKYKKGGASQANVSAGVSVASSSTASTAGMLMAHVEGGVSIFVQGGKEYWVSKKGN